MNINLSGHLIGTLMKITCVILISNGIKVSPSKPLFHFGVTDFSTVVETATFIDKSLLIREVFRHNFVLVTTPRFFGKSTNIDMLKKFMEIEIDSNGNPKSQGNMLMKPVKDTNNYNLFVANKLQITEHSTVMSEHFGKYPVIHVDLKCREVITSYEDAVTFCKNVVHKSFEQHRYLIRSQKLSDVEKETCYIWCDERSFKNYTTDNVTLGLKTLSTYLYKHFGRRKCFVLIDEYDNLIIRSTIKVLDKVELRRIIRLNVGIVSTLINNNDIYVNRGLITGVSYVAGVYLSTIHNVTICRFLEHHRFVDYFGVTVVEADRIFARPELKLNQSCVANVTLSGYVSRMGKRMYSLYTVLQFVHTHSSRP